MGLKREMFKAHVVLLSSIIFLKVYFRFVEISLFDFVEEYTGSDGLCKQRLGDRCTTLILKLKLTKLTYISVLW